MGAAFFQGFVILLVLAMLAYLAWVGLATFVFVKSRRRGGWTVVWLLVVFAPFLWFGVSLLQGRWELVAQRKAEQATHDRAEAAYRKLCVAPTLEVVRAARRPGGTILVRNAEAYGRSYFSPGSALSYAGSPFGAVI